MSHASTKRACATLLAWIATQPNGASTIECAQHAGVSTKTAWTRLSALRMSGDVLPCRVAGDRSRVRWHTQERGAALLDAMAAHEEMRPVQRWLRVGEWEHLPRGGA